VPAATAVAAAQGPCLCGHWTHESSLPDGRWLLQSLWVVHQSLCSVLHLRFFLSTGSYTEEGGGRRKSNTWVPSIILYWNRYGGLNLGAAVGVKVKNTAPKSRESTQIKSRGPDLGAPAGVALTQYITGFGFPESVWRRTTLDRLSKKNNPLYF